MKRLKKDIVLNDTAFATASSDMQALRERTEQLKEKMEQMYEDLKNALDTPTGAALDLTAKNVLIQPIKDLLLVVGHISSTLTEIIGTGYYKDVFVKFEDLNKSIKFDK